jgi:hypothetical protein
VEAPAAAKKKPAKKKTETAEVAKSEATEEPKKKPGRKKKTETAES